MAKIGEKLIRDGNKIIHVKQHDFTKEVQHAKQLRDHGKTDMGDSKLVASIPLALVNEWLKAAGVAWDDPARDDVIRKNILNKDNAAFRVWGGTY